jgi:hypothetical protein
LKAANLDELAELKKMDMAQMEAYARKVGWLQEGMKWDQDANDKTRKDIEDIYAAMNASWFTGSDRDAVIKPFEKVIPVIEKAGNAGKDAGKKTKEHYVYAKDSVGGLMKAISDLEEKLKRMGTSNKDWMPTKDEIETKKEELEAYTSGLAARWGNDLAAMRAAIKSGVDDLQPQWQAQEPVIEQEMPQLGALLSIKEEFDDNIRKLEEGAKKIIKDVGNDLGKLIGKSLVDSLKNVLMGDGKVTLKDVLTSIFAATLDAVGMLFSTFMEDLFKSMWEKIGAQKAADQAADWIITGIETAVKLLLKRNVEPSGALLPINPGTFVQEQTLAISNAQQAAQMFKHSINIESGGIIKLRADGPDLIAAIDMGESFAISRTLGT